jgi:indole-3-glycerol phosphate synthase
MIEISYRKHGFITRLTGIVDMEAMRSFRFQMEDELAGTEGEFVLLVDARNFQTFTADAQAGFEELLESAREHGMVRVSVLGISTVLASLFCSIMVQTDLMESYQFLDLAYETDWKNEMKTWLDTPFTSTS